MTRYQEASIEINVIARMIINEWRLGYIKVDDTCLEIMLKDLEESLNRYDYEFQEVLKPMKKAA